MQENPQLVPTTPGELDKIDEATISCPSSKQAISVMSCWGSKKRQSYARLVKNGVKKHEAFYFIEYNKGEEI